MRFFKVERFLPLPSLRMFGFLKRWLRREVTVGKQCADDLPTDLPSCGESGGSNNGLGPSTGIHDFLELPLAPIVAQIPASAKLGGTLPSGASARIPLKTIISQLSQGRVLVSLQELKQWARPQIFTVSPDYNSHRVELPLPEIIGRLGPHQLPRRGSQTRIEVSDQIAAPFGPNEKTPPLRDQHSQASAASSRNGNELLLGDIAGGCRSSQFLGASRHSRESEKMGGGNGSSGVVPQLPNGTSHSEVVLPIADLIQSWPEVVRRELSGTDVSAHVLALPCGQIEKELKRGRVQFAWNQIRSWIRPALACSKSTDTAELILDLPLHIIAPAFLTQRKGQGTPKRQLTCASDLPALFVARAKAAPTPAPESLDSSIGTHPRRLAEDTEQAGRAARVEGEPVPGSGSDFGCIFGQPEKRNWSPTEIIERTTALQGITGALLATLDGLYIAGRLPEKLSGERFAAFVPSLYVRLAQCSKELDLKEPNYLTVHIEEFPVQVFRTGRMFFTVLGRLGEALPQQQLSAIATALSRPAHVF